VVLKALNDHQETFESALTELKNLTEQHNEQMRIGREMVNKWQHLFFKAFWEVLQLRKHVAVETLEQVGVDLRVNELDPDFSFEGAIEEMLGENFGP
jgi:hypothetical protein